MRKRFAVLLLLPMLVASCANDAKDYYVDSNPFQLSRNGDLFLNDFEDPSYDDLTIVENASTTIANSEIGESFNILRISDTCHSCQEFKTSFASFIKDTFLDVIVYSGSDTSIEANINSLENHFDKIERSVDYPFLSRTPTWYIGNEKEGIKIFNWGYSNKKTLANNFLKQCSLTNLYKFSSIEALKKGLEDANALVYLLDSKNEKSLSFYKDFLYEKAIKSKKRTYVFVNERATSKEKVSAIEYFEEHSLIVNNEKESLENESSLKTLVNSYYE